LVVEEGSGQAGDLFKSRSQVNLAHALVAIQRVNAFSQCVLFDSPLKQFKF
jgi:hypothetical protein